MEPEIFEGTARDVKIRMAAIPDTQMVRVIVGHPSLTVIARRLQAIAETNGMTGPVHDVLIRDLDNDR